MISISLFFSFIYYFLSSFYLGFILTFFFYFLGAVLRGKHVYVRKVKGLKPITVVTNHMIWGLEVLVLSAWPSGREEGLELNRLLMANDLINYAYIPKPVWKHKKERAQRASRADVGEWSCTPFLMPCPVHLFHPAVPASCFIIINQWSSK